MEQVEPVMIPEETARGVDIFYELGDLIGATVTVLVAQAQDPSAARFAAEGTISVTGDIEVAIWSGGDIDGIVCGLPVRKEGDLEAIRDLYILENIRFLFCADFYNFRRYIPAFCVGVSLFCFPCLDGGLLFFVEFWVE